MAFWAFGLLTARQNALMNEKKKKIIRRFRLFEATEAKLEMD